MNLRSLPLVAILLLAVSFSVRAQTCCSGGAPLSGNLGLPIVGQHTWQLALSYDLNVLKTLKVGSEKLNERNRERITHSIMFEGGYTFSDRFSTDFFISYVRQERNISNPGLPEQNQHTTGIGDAVMLMKYNIINTGPVLWTFGAGPKIPTGASDVTNNGILVGADLQPGSGAWDGIFWSTLVHQPGSRKSMNLSLVSSFRLTGTNEDFRQSQSYRFGNELQLIAGISDRLLVGTLLVDPSLSFRLRRALEDRVDDVELPNTGGKWIFIYPSIGLSITSNLRFNLGFELPLYANVSGTQLTPTYRLNTGFYYIFGGKSDLLNLQPQSNVN